MGAEPERALDRTISKPREKQGNGNGKAPHARYRHFAFDDPRE